MINHLYDFSMPMQMPHARTKYEGIQFHSVPGGLNPEHDTLLRDLLFPAVQCFNSDWSWILSMILCLGICSPRCKAVKLQHLEPTGKVTWTLLSLMKPGFSAD